MQHRQQSVCLLCTQQLPVTFLRLCLVLANPQENIQAVRFSKHRLSTLDTHISFAGLTRYACVLQSCTVPPCCNSWVVRCIQSNAFKVPQSDTSLPRSHKEFDTLCSCHLSVL